MNASQAICVMFKADERKALLESAEFLRAMHEFDGTPEAVQRLADLGTHILLPEDQRPPLGTRIRHEA
jgi:hypothetical protein